MSAYTDADQRADLAFLVGVDYGKAKGRADLAAEIERRLLALANSEDYHPWAMAIIGQDAVKCVRASIAADPSP